MPSLKSQQNSNGSNDEFEEDSASNNESEGEKKRLTSDDIATSVSGSDTTEDTPVGIGDENPAYAPQLLVR